MEPNNLETQIKAKLDSREINPSQNSWDRLDAMLTLNEKPKNKFPWLMLAACFIGFVFIGTIIYNSFLTSPTANDNATQNSIVQENKDDNNNNQKPKINEVNNPSEIQNQNSKIASQNLKSKIKNRVSIIKNNQNQIAIIKKVINPEIKNENNPNQILENNVAVIPNQIAEIKAQEFAKPQENRLKIDANSLLSKVDNELKTEYRETVFKKISRKYQNVKTAFAERNIQK